MTYLLDTNTCIGWLRQNQPQLVARIQAQAQTDIVLVPVHGHTSEIDIAELKKTGILRSFRDGVAVHGQ